MIPYFDQPALRLGPVNIHAFGVLVALAVLVAAAVMRRRADRDDLEDRVVQSFASWVVIGGFIGAHLVDRLVYFPAKTWADPMSLVRVFDGLSSFGGFLGAVVVILIRRTTFQGRTWQYLDSLAFAFPFGWIFGRLGCFVAFDHPGSATTFLLGQRYSDGVVRHNLGLDEALYSVLIAACFLALGSERRRPGLYVGLLAVGYAPFRFTIDFLRKVDARYLGLTPAQYGSIAVLAGGIAILAVTQRGPTSVLAQTRTSPIS